MKKSTFKKGMKLAALFTAVTLSVGVLAGCGAKSTDKDEQGRTIVEVGGWPTKEGTEKTNIEQRKARFEEANPEFTIKPSEWSFDLKSFYAKASGGQMPTVFNCYYTEANQLIESGHAADLTEALKEEGFYDYMNKDLLKLVSKDGKVYGFPFGAHAMGIAYNVEAFEKAGLMNEDGTPMQPKTWDELAQFAVKIKEATGKAGFVFPTANNNGGWHFTQVAWSYGANFMEQDSEGKWHATFNSPECAEALQWVKDLKWKYDVLPSNTFIDYAELFKTFGTGAAAMVIGAGDTPSAVASYDMAPETIGLMAIPSGPKKRVSLLTGSMYAVSDTATEDQIKGALKWIKTSYNPELSEESKTNKEKNMQTNLEKNLLVTAKSMSIWNGDSEVIKFDDELRAKNANANMNHVKLYNDFVNDMGDCELRAEEPVCCQQLYATLDNCIQEVLTNKDADPAALLEKANADFQQDYLDNL